MSQFTDKKWTQTSAQKQRNEPLSTYTFILMTNSQTKKTQKRVLHDSMSSIDEKENRGPEGYQLNEPCKVNPTFKIPLQISFFRLNS